MNNKKIQLNQIFNGKYVSIVNILLLAPKSIPWSLHIHILHLCLKRNVCLSLPSLPLVSNKMVIMLSTSIHNELHAQKVMPSCLSPDTDFYVHLFCPVYCCVDRIEHPHTPSSLPSALYPLLCIYGYFWSRLIMWDSSADEHCFGWYWEVGDTMRVMRQPFAGKIGWKRDDNEWDELHIMF